MGRGVPPIAAMFTPSYIQQLFPNRKQFTVKEAEMDTAISGKPILNHQLGNMREVPGVVRHKNETRLFRDCTNEQIEIVNWLSQFL